MTKMMRLIVAAWAIIGLAACEGGGVDLNVNNTDNSVDNGGGDGGDDDDNPCASYTPAGSNAAVRGTFDGTNCTYSSTFVSDANPITVDLTIPFISGVHIFQDSLFVGEDVDSGAAPQEGEGPTLTIAAGATLAFQDSADYVLINRGSQILANGTANAPITFTSFTDAVNDTAGANDVSQWGGIQINGNGLTNNCSDDDRANDTCHVLAEGQPSHYGGNNNEESSGSLQYVIVKHTGFEVAPGSELNGITFNAVGSGTVVNNVQAYSTFDDGFEFFGGAVNVTNAVLLYVRDDSLDFSDGYIGTIENALVIHWQTEGNRCIELDNIGEERSAGGEPFDTAPLTRPTIRNLTCITSNADASTHGDSEGPLVRQGGQLLLENAIVYGGYGTSVSATASNECYEIESDVALAFAGDGDHTVTNSVIGCEESVKGALANGDELTEWYLGANPSTNGADYSFNAGNVIIADPANANTTILEPGSYLTASAIVDETGTDTGLDATTIGAVPDGASDWTSPWAFGLRDNNADVPLWFAVP
jgi:hypothetical protein